MAFFGVGLVDAWGVVDVNLVASVADRGMLLDAHVCMQREDTGEVGGLGVYIGSMKVHQEIF